MTNVLQSFLNAGLMDIGEDDEKFKKLYKTSQDVAKRLAKKKSDAIQYTLVALDPDVPVDDPVLAEVEANLQRHWNTYKSKYPETPRQIIRPIIFEGLRAASETEVSIAAIVWLTGSTYIRHRYLGPEKGVCEQFLLHMGMVAEERAAQDWAGTGQTVAPALPVFNSAATISKTVGINEKDLTAKLAAASGPRDPDGEAISPGLNEFSPANGQDWTDIFVPAASKAISEAVNRSVFAVVNNVAKYNEQLQEEIKENLGAITTSLSGYVRDSLRSVAANERRNTLLWWRETLFSPLLKRGYREMDATTAALLMAYDLHNQVTEYCPQSVDYLLLEAFRDVKNSLGDSTAKISVIELCERLTGGDDSATLRHLLGEMNADSSRRPLLALVQSALAGQTIRSDQLPRQVGLESEAKIGLEEYTVWFFHDLQARRLASGK